MADQFGNNVDGEVWVPAKAATTRTIRGKIKEVAFPTGETWWTFHCPGCKDGHTVNNTWDFDGSYEAPTFNPSVLTYGSPWQTDVPRCHSFVRNGRIEYLTDCTHSLAGQTVDLPDWEARNAGTLRPPVGD